MSDPVATYDVNPLTSWLGELDPPLYPVRSVIDARQVFVNHYPNDTFVEECRQHTDLAKWYLTENIINMGPPDSLGLVPLPPEEIPPEDGVTGYRVIPVANPTVAVDPATVYPREKWDAVNFPNGQPQTFPVPGTLVRGADENTNIAATLDDASPPADEDSTAERTVEDEIDAMDEAEDEHERHEHKAKAKAKKEKEDKEEEERRAKNGEQVMRLSEAEEKGILPKKDRRHE